MSRVGNRLITVPKDVQVNVNGSIVEVKSIKGSLTRTFNEDISISLDGDVIKVTRPSEEKKHKARGWRPRLWPLSFFQRFPYSS